MHHHDDLEEGKLLFVTLPSAWHPRQNLLKRNSAQCEHITTSTTCPSTRSRALHPTNHDQIHQSSSNSITIIGLSSPVHTSLLLSVECVSIPHLQIYLREWLRAYIFGTTCPFPTPVSLARSPTSAELLFHTSSGVLQATLQIDVMPCISPLRAQVQVTSASTFVTEAGARASLLPGEHRLLRALYSALSEHCAGETRVIYKARYVRLRATRNVRAGTAGNALVAEIPEPMERNKVVEFLHDWAARTMFAATSAAIATQGAIAYTPNDRGIEVEIRNGEGRCTATVNAKVQTRRTVRRYVVIVLVSSDKLRHREVRRIVRSMGKDLLESFEKCRLHWT